MSKRLQVVVAEDEYELFQSTAKSHGLTLSEWARQTLRRAGDDRLTDAEVKRKLAVLDWATSLNLGPEVDIETMRAQINSRFEGPLPEP